MEHLLINETPYALEEQDYEMTLLRWLRERHGLTGTKCGCNVGQCGSCNVIVDGKVRRSCVLKCKTLLGKRITTIEGLARGEKLHPVQESFLACGVMQCGFCTPAQVLTVVALLEANPTPTREEIDKAFKGVLCRCGSYVRVLKAIERAAAILRGERWTDENGNDPDRVIGNSYNMPDAVDKITGRLKFCSDYYFENQVYGKLVFAEYPHAKLVDIDVDTCMALPGVQYVQCYKTTPITMVGPLQKDMPIIAYGKVRHVGEVVAIVYADTQEQAEYAASRLKVTYELLQNVLSVEQARISGAPLVHEDCDGNVSVRCTIRKGDVDTAFRDAAAVVQGEYYSQRIEHNYIETECSTAVPNDRGGVDIYTVSQGPFGERASTAAYLGIDECRINVHQTPLGGSFGGKDGHPLPVLVSYAAMKLGRPASVAVSRKDSYRFSTKRHPWTCRIKLAADKEGRITALKNDMVSDGGAYKSFSPRVLPQGVSYATGPYEILNMSLDGKVYYTNNLTSGAMRGYGSPQTIFAIEVALDELARKLKMDPFTIRRINGLRTGSEAATGMIIPEGHAYLKTLDAVEKKYYEEFLPLKEQDPAIGIGVASGWRHILGGVGPAEETRVGLELLDDGRVQMKACCAQMGNETLVGLAQITAASLGLRYEDIDILSDLQTDLTPWSAHVMASRGLILWGTALEAAAKTFSRRVTEAAKRLIGGNAVFRDGKIVDEGTGWTLCGLKEFKERVGGSFEVVEQARMPRTYYPLEDANRSRAIPAEEYRTHHTNSYVSALVALKADPEKNTVRVIKMYAAFDVGTPINPEATKRQGEGGLLMGMGQGLREEFELEDGYIKTDSMVKYQIPQMTDTPEIEEAFVDNYDPSGPFGAKGIGELGLLPIQPAILNAYYDATGVRLRKIPLLKYI